MPGSEKYCSFDYKPLVDKFIKDGVLTGKDILTFYKEKKGVTEIKDKARNGIIIQVIGALTYSYNLLIYEDGNNVYKLLNLKEHEDYERKREEPGRRRVLEENQYY